MEECGIGNRKIPRLIFKDEEIISFLFDAGPIFKCF